MVQVTQDDPRIIMDQFESIGCHKFYMSVNYKADMMRSITQSVGS